MSKDQLNAFLEQVAADTSLQEKLKAAKSSEDVVGIANEHGHDFGAEHLIQLSEEELEEVAGGVNATQVVNGILLGIITQGAAGAV